MTGPVLRNHSSTVTRAKRPVTATWTALRTFWMAPRGNGRIGSIQPCARTTGAIKRKAADRSEERRVGKEGRSRWSPYHYKKKTSQTSMVQMVADIG